MSRASTFPLAQPVQAPGLLESQKPTLLLQGIVETYMASKRSKLDGSIHKALNTNDPRIQLDTIRHKWVEREVDDIPLEELYKNVDEDEREFFDAMRSYERDAEKDNKVGVSMEEHHTFDQVLAAISDAQVRYNTKDRIRFFAPIREAFEKLSENLETCQALLELMPKQAVDFFSIICGGYKLIIGAAGRLKSINDAVANAMVQIPTLIGKSRRIRAVNNKGSPKLRNLCSALYVAILRTMSQILEYYRQKAVSKTFSIILKPEPFHKTILRAINAMKQCSVAIDKEAELLSMETNKETNYVVKTSKILTEDVFKKVSMVEEQADEIYQKADDIHELVRSLSQESQLNSKRTRLVEDALNYITTHFMAKPFQETRSHNYKDFPTPSTSPQDSTSFWKAFGVPKKLISRLSDQETPKVDLYANLESGLNSTLEDQESAIIMMESPHLQKWLGRTKSSILFVHGGPQQSRGHRSPLSFVCAKLSSSLKGARNSLKESSRKSNPRNTIIDLHFFCGEHVDWRDNHLENGPAGVLNSLLAQLLSQYDDFDLGIIRHLKKVKPDNIEALGKVFRKLIAQLPVATIVFCIIDGLVFYHDRERSEACELLVEKLIALARVERRDGCVFKLLVTNTVELRLGAVEELDEQEEVLWIPERLERGGGFTEGLWNEGVGREIADLTDS